MASFEIAHKMVVKSEGGYSTLEWDRGNYICDSGGKGYEANGTSQAGKTAKDFTCSSGSLKFVGTNWGISAPVLSDYLGRTPTVSDMKNLSFTTAKSIFKKSFWDKINGDGIKNQSVANMLYDSIVQSSGMTKSILNKTFSQLNVSSVSSLSSSDTLAKINKANPEKLFETFKVNRIQAYKDAGQTWGIKRTGDIVFEFVKAHPLATAVGFFAFALAVTTVAYWYNNRDKINLKEMVSGNRLELS
jgi:lysozyme family protein